MTAGSLYAFGRYALDGRARTLHRDGVRVPLSDRYVGVLLHLAAHAGAIVSKDELVTAGWGDVAVTDNSLEQAISVLRRTLGPGPDQRPYLETVPRRGYRLVATVTRTAASHSDDDLDALLAPHRAWLDGRAALESLEGSRIRQARAVFEGVVASIPDQASAHIGLANACVLQFEMTRTDQVPDADALRLAVHHARQACRLDAEYGEAWATLGFVLERAGHHLDALAAARRAIALEPDNWRHHLRLASTAWGEERLRAARRTLVIFPGCPLAHWLAATILVARATFVDAERELELGLVADRSRESDARFGGVGLHWLLGLIRLAHGDDAGAMDAFARELDNEAGGHLYARECCANTWYAIGALHLRRGRRADAASAFAEALRRVARHPLARLGSILAAQGAHDPVADPLSEPVADDAPFERLLCAAVADVWRGDHPRAALRLRAALAHAAAGSAGWLLPLEPLLNVGAAGDDWAPTLAALRTRAA